MLNQMAVHRPRNQRLMQENRRTALGKLRKGPRERRLARKSAAAAPAAKPAKPAVNLKALDQCPRRRNVEHCLGHEDARQRRAVLFRTAYPATKIGKQCLDPYQFQNRIEELVALPPSNLFAVEQGYIVRPSFASARCTGFRRIRMSVA